MSATASTAARGSRRPRLVTAGGLVGAGAGPDIQYRPRIAERSTDPCGDPRLGAPRHGVSGSDGVIQLRAGHVAAFLAVTIPTPRRGLASLRWVLVNCAPFHHLASTPISYRHIGDMSRAA